jgi:hypothetical protein
MRSTIVRCSACDRALTLPHTVGSGTLTCTHCSQATRLWLFPALYREKSGTEAQHLLDEGHSSCMNHPTKQAVTVCNGCGKFLCSLCDIDWNGEHVCSTCIEHRKSDDTKNELRSEYIHYDRVVLALALASFVLYFLGVVLAPIALYIGWRYWNEPWRPVPYRKWGMVAYIALAFLILLGWGTLFVFFFINL